MSAKAISLIGGPSDGQQVCIDPDDKAFSRDIIVPYPLASDHSSAAVPRGFAEARYTARAVMTSSGGVTYWAHELLTDQAALARLIDKYHPAAIARLIDRYKP